MPTIDSRPGAVRHSATSGAERYLPEAGLETVETRFLYKDIIKLIVARPVRGKQNQVVPSLPAA